jgi:integrase
VSEQTPPYSFPSPELLRSQLGHAVAMAAKQDQIVYMLTGARSAEVLGLQVGDVNLTRGVIYVREHADRRLKTAGSRRVVPLAPQLREILTAYLFANGDAPADDALLFPSSSGSMISDWRKVLDRVAVRAGFAKGQVRTRAFRHSYASARLQCLDNGQPISLYTVSRELGHGSETMLRERYAHLGQIRYRGEHVEFRVEQHREALADRLVALTATDSATLETS